MVNGKMELEFERDEVINLIKKYYYKTYPIKSCHVQLKAENIKDRLKEIDLFHQDDLYYNTIVRTIVTGKMQGKDGELNSFREELNVEGTKELIKTALAPKYNIDDLCIHANFVSNSNNGFDVVVTHVTGSVDKKVLTKRFK